MNLKPIKANMTELSLSGDEDIRVLFSYETPVAFTRLTEEGRMFYRTSTYYSRTTNRHINAWLPKDQAHEVEQILIDGIIGAR